VVCAESRCIVALRRSSSRDGDKSDGSLEDSNGLDSIAQQLQPLERVSGGTAVLLLLVDWSYSGIAPDDLMGRGALFDSIEQRLGRVLRAGTPFARTKRDMLAVMLQDISSPNDAVIVANRLQGEMQQPFPISGETVQLSSTIGISVSRLSEPNSRQILRLIGQADHSLQKARDRGQFGSIHLHRSLPLSWSAPRLPRFLSRTDTKAG
jgi:hypothetical protein